MTAPLKTIEGSGDIAAAMREKFGGDSLGELRRNLDGYLTHVAERLGG